jgi:hypothetical protein
MPEKALLIRQYVGHLHNVFHRAGFYTVWQQNTIQAQKDASFITERIKDAYLTYFQELSSNEHSKKRSAPLYKGP